jgi:hypothetical protein
VSPYRTSANVALLHLAAGLAGVLVFHGRPRLPLPVVLALFVGAGISVSLLHRAWTELSMRPLPARVRWRIRLQMAFITPIAGPLYWLWLRPRDRPAA